MVTLFNAVMASMSAYVKLVPTMYPCPLCSAPRIASKCA